MARLLVNTSLSGELDVMIVASVNFCDVGLEHIGLLVIGMFTLLSSTGGKGAVPWKYFSLC